MKITIIPYRFPMGQYQKLLKPQQSSWKVIIMKQVIDNKKKKSLPKGIRHLASGKFIADVCINGKRKTKTVDTLEEAIIERQKMLNNDVPTSFTKDRSRTARSRRSRRASGRHGNLTSGASSATPRKPPCIRCSEPKRRSAA